MSAMRYLLRGSAGGADAPRRVGSRDRDLTTRTTADHGETATNQAAGRRYPVNATPGSVLFLLRVVGCLRGMATTLQVQHSYLEAMRPYAHRALRAALRPANGVLLRQQQASEVYVAPAPVGPMQVELQRLVEQLCAEGVTLGMSVCVYHEGSLLGNAWAGKLESAAAPHTGLHLAAPVPQPAALSPCEPAESRRRRRRPSPNPHPLTTPYRRRAGHAEPTASFGG